jgi:hypothetical protein
VQRLRLPFGLDFSQRLVRSDVAGGVGDGSCDVPSVSRGCSGERFTPVGKLVWASSIRTARFRNDRGLILSFRSVSVTAKPAHWFRSATAAGASNSPRHCHVSNSSGAEIPPTRKRKSGEPHGH